MTSGAVPGAPPDATGLPGETLIDVFRSVAREGSASATFHVDGGPVTISAAALVEQAETTASVLTSLGVRSGDRVGIIGRNRPEWLRSALACWAAGATAVPLPFHLRIRDPNAFARGLERLIRTAACRVVLSEDRFLGSLPADVAVPWDVGAGAGESPPPDGDGRIDALASDRSHDDLAVVQFTSGSTAEPKGACLTHRSVLAAVSGYAAVLGARPGVDRFVSWLPFFHDWGLFGFALRPLMLGCDVHVLPTERFAASPERWFRVVTDVRATMTAGPPSSVLAALRSLGDTGRDGALDLSSIRWFHLGAERTDPNAVDEIAARTGRMGMRPEAIGTSYGMAEATLGLTGARPGTGQRFDHVDPDALARGIAEPVRPGLGRRVTSCGPPLPSVRLRITDGAQVLPTRRVGEIQAAGPSIMRGYLGDGPEPTDQPFDDGWLRTGDLGYLADGELFVVGRRKDLIIAQGRNVAPEDAEWAAARVEGVRAGRVVAFAPPDAPEGTMVVALEATRDADLDSLPARVRHAVTDAVEVIPAEVLVLDDGAIPKTTSGKLRRSEVRERHRRGELGVERSD